MLRKLVIFQFSSHLARLGTRDWIHQFKIQILRVIILIGFNLIHNVWPKPISLYPTPQSSWNLKFLDSKGLNKSLDLCKNIRLIIRLKRNIRIDYSFSYKGDPNSQIHYSVWYKRNPNNSNSIRFIPKGIIRFLINSYSAELFLFVWTLAPQLSRLSFTSPWCSSAHNLAADCAIKNSKFDTFINLKWHWDKQQLIIQLSV